MSSSSSGSPVSVFERFVIRPSRKIEDPIEREKDYRKNLRRLIISAYLFLATASLLLVIPLYPVPVILLLAIITSLVGFRSHLPGLLIGALVFIPAYAYQAGTPLWWLLIFLFLIGVSAARAINEPTNIVAPLTGLFAGALSLTPLFIFAIPLMLSVALLEERGKLFDHLGMVMMFVMIFIPFHGIAFSESVILSVGPEISSMRPEQIYDVMKVHPLPIFTQITYLPNPPLASLDIPAFQQTFSSAFETSPFFHPYLFLILDRLILLYVPLLMAVSLSLISVVHRLWPWLVERGINLTVVLKYSYLPTLIVGTILFLIPLQALSSSLDYYTGLNPVPSLPSELSGGQAFLALLGSAAVFGSALTLSSLRLARRDEIAVLSANLISNGKKLSEEIAGFFSTMRSIQSTCAGIDLSMENATTSKQHEEVRITLTGVDTMPYKVLREKKNLLEKLNKDRAQTVASTNHRLFQYHAERVSHYNDTVSKLVSLGIQGTKPLQKVAVSELSLETPQAVIKRQEELNRRFLELAERALGNGERLVMAVKKDFDRTIDPTSILIGKKFLERGEGEAALQSLVTTLSSLSERYSKSVGKIGQSLRKIIARALEIYDSHLLPLNESLGREASESKTAQIALQLSSYQAELGMSTTIVSLPDVMERLEFLESGTRMILSELLILLRDFEKMNDSRVPGEFNWGKNSQLVADIDSALRFLDDHTTKDLDDRLANVEFVIKTIEDAAATLRKYIIMNEFILNYPNMEPLIIAKLHESGHVSAKELPVRPKYASQYLKLFATKSYAEVVYDSRYSKIERRRR